MRLELVNLEVIEERFRRFIMDKSSFAKEEKVKLSRGEIRCELFPQMWGSTSLGFDGIGGCAMTEEYTTVVHVSNTDVYGVFFGKKLAYIIKNPNQQFFTDLRERNMASQHESKRYDAEDAKILCIQYVREEDYF